MEPSHRSLFDVLRENLVQEGGRNYIHRLIYFGRHNFAEGVDSMRDFFEKDIRNVNGKCYDEELSGALIHYPKHFIHVLEGSENTLVEHIGNIFAKPRANEDKFGSVKVLIVWHHIHQRYFLDWFCVTGIPPTLLEEIRPERSVEETEKIMKIFISKVTKLAELLVTQVMHTSDNRVQNISTKAHDLLPEYAVLESLLDLPTLMDIHRYAELYATVKESIPYQERVWPAPTDFVPYDVYDLPYQPKELKEKHVQDSVSGSLSSSVPMRQKSQYK